MTVSSTYSFIASSPANGMGVSVKKQAFFPPSVQRIDYVKSCYLAVGYTSYASFVYFTFTGKERDEETGYNYHGARYYDATLLTCFISIDQYADKYPTLSPYHYCAWNPVKIIDPTGDTVVLSSTANEIHMLYYNKNKEYTDLYDKLHSCRDYLL